MSADGRILTGRWMRVIRASPAPRLRLLCFAHAGGSASFFRTWAPAVPGDVELVAVRYPGREDRILEPPATTMPQLAAPIAEVVAELRGVPLVLFGHSMGALVAYEVARRLPARHLTGLFVSGRAAPGAGGSEGLATADDDALVDSLTELGHTPAEFLTRPELRDLVLPAYRADCGIVEGYDREWAERAAEALPIPLTVYHGVDDRDVDDRDAAGWASVTRSDFGVRAFPGGHFYLVEHADTLVSDLLSRAAGPLPGRAAGTGRTA
ncbi:thioesterase II family protein [Micromonospora fluostatini]|uniref:thioesterase II family protein n=1 Tax=Micromonospora sp. JCM 30529 TaxID=3421643 RepID=UPI003D16C841